MRRRRQAKIVATLGPATSSPEAIAAVFEAGADVFRLNLSHGGRDEHRRRCERLRGLERRFGRPIAVLADLQGPKLRIGRFREGAAALTPGRSFRLDLEASPGDGERVQLPHPEVFGVIEPGSRLLLDDGRVVLEARSREPGRVLCEVISGTRLSDRKGLNLPGVLLPIPALTDKDRADLAFALALGVDWIALSFVQRPEDVAEAKRLVAGRAGIMAKLEKPSAIDSLAGIIELSDAVMVARGDLGVELKPEEVPGVQKRILRACRQAGKPAVVATQMLESMVASPTPTRAEASDVATAVYDGADALMLSAETAIGRHAAEAVAMMERIMVTVEQDPLHGGQTAAPEATGADAIAAAARQVARTVDAAAIVAYSVTGSTALRASRARPDVPILGLTPSLASARRLALAWGVHSVHTEDARDFIDMVNRAGAVARAEGFAGSGDKLVITAGVPFGTPGSTNTLRLAWVD